MARFADVSNAAGTARAFALAALAVCLATTGCAHRVVLFSPALTPADTILLSAPSLQRFCAAIAPHCALRSGGAAMRDAYDPELLKDAWRSLAACTNTVFMLQSATYESILAASVLPLRLFVLTVDFSPGAIDYLGPRDFSRGLSEMLQPLAERVRIREIIGISRRDAQLTLRCHDRQTLSGRRGDILAGQVYPAVDASGADTYQQALLLFGVTRLPQHTVEQHLEEWLSMMPATLPRPQVKALP